MSDAVTIPAVDAALVARYSGITIPTGTPVVATPVEVFLEEPSSEEFPERVYPSIVLKLFSVIPDLARWHSDDDEHYEEEVGYSAIPDPPTRTMRQVPIPMRLMYSLDLWHRVRSSEARDLLQEVIIRRTHPRGSMAVGAVKVWAMWGGGIRNLDEVEVDEMILHKSLTLEILADILPTTTTVTEKVVTKVLWNAFGLGTKLASPTQTVLTGEQYLDLQFEVTEIGESAVP